MSDQSPETLVTVFGHSDILLGVYGSDLLYSFFMVPKSAVIIIYPPYWDSSDYELYVNNIGLFAEKFFTNGERAKICERRPNSNECLLRGTRDRNVTLSLQDSVIHTWNAMQEVWSAKYSLNLSFY